MDYISTRGGGPVSSAEAIKTGIAPDGGLFVPDSLPIVRESLLKEMKSMNYQGRAVEILSLFLTDFTREEIKACVEQAYNRDSFEDPGIAPLKKISESLYVMELWHGPTSAFKDMALQIMPRFLPLAVAKTGEKNEIVILVATSGDTGKAALEGFRDVPGTRIMVFFPDQGVSEVQRLQMVTQEGNNVGVAAVKGNFDDAQNGVKAIFANKELAGELEEKGFKFSSANSINWGRLAPQIVYYFSAYLDLLNDQAISPGEPVNFVVPTGNFGNILAAYYAKEAGLPIGKLICASNENKVLTDFIRDGKYDRQRQFHKTASPSMDILISSNLERLLFHLSGNNYRAVSKWMKELVESGHYDVGPDILAKIRQDFWSGYASDQETMEAIKAIFREKGYLIDTHTGVGLNVYEKYQAETGDRTPAVILSTASPYKFNSSVVESLLGPESIEGKSEFELLEILSGESKTSIPKNLKGLDKKPLLHKQVVEKEDLTQVVRKFLDK
jgi:threonine synthase